MGKKAKTKKGEQRAQGRKVDQSTLPPPPPPIEEELGSKRLLKEPKVPGTRFKVLDPELDGYDDGGVGDLTLLIDLEDHVLRRKRGENQYFTAVKTDVLPRVTSGQMGSMARRDQKVHLATLLFSDGEAGKVDEDEDNVNPSEIYRENLDRGDAELQKRREDRLKTSKKSLKLSNYLREPACAAISLTEISKRVLIVYGKEKADVALRCADKAILMSSDQFYDNDEIAIEADEDPVIDSKHEPNATCPGLTHPSSLKFFPERVASLCLRAAYLHRGNALAAMGREEEAREAYEKVIPILAPEPRVCRVDWERCSALVNIANSYSRQGKFDVAEEFYAKGEQLGLDHMEAENGNKVEGMGISIEARRFKAFALKKIGREEEARSLLRSVIEDQREYSELMQKEKELMKAELEKQDQQKQEPAAAAAAAANVEQPVSA